MPNYQNGKIYQIVNDIDDEIYVGSTTKALSARMADHRKALNHKTKKNSRFYKFMTQLGVEHFRIELIKNHPCESVEELRAEEGKFIKERGTLNSKIAGRDRKEYYNDNKDLELEKQKIYRENNKEKIQVKNQKYEESHKEEIKKRKQEYYLKNKEKINARNKAYYEKQKAGN